MKIGQEIAFKINHRWFLHQITSITDTEITCGPYTLNHELRRVKGSGFPRFGVPATPQIKDEALRYELIKKIDLTKLTTEKLSEVCALCERSL